MLLPDGQPAIRVCLPGIRWMQHEAYSKVGVVGSASRVLARRCAARADYQKDGACNRSRVVSGITETRD